MSTTPLLTWITGANKKTSSHSSHDTNLLSNTQPIRKDHSPDPRPLIFRILDILDHKVEKITGLSTSISYIDRILEDMGY